MKNVFFLLMAFLASSLSCAAETGLVDERARSSAITLYDTYFTSCRCFLVAGTDSTGTDAYFLALTFEDEPFELVNELVIGLKGGDKVSMPIAHSPRRADVRYRRLKNANIKYVTLYFSISSEQLVKIMEEDTRYLLLKTNVSESKINIRNVKNALSEIYKQLTIN